MQNSKQKTNSSVDTVEKINGSLATKDADKVEVFSNFYQLTLQRQGELLPSLGVRRPSSANFSHFNILL
jgi:hypothetical protein